MYGTLTGRYKKPSSQQATRLRSEWSTETAISEVTDFKEQHIFFEKHVIAVFLDIQAAFDTISPEKIKAALKEHKIDPLKNL